MYHHVKKLMYTVTWTSRTPGKLRDAKPENFAGEYDPMQASAHKDAVSLFERYANGGDNPKLKDWVDEPCPP
jgi:putative membrane protein